MTLLQTFANEPPALERSRVAETRSRGLANAGEALLWLVVVAILILRHQVWRDEMRALSLAISGDNLVEMLRNVRGEGHPLLWYMILRASFYAVQDTIVLKLASFTIAAAVILLVVYKSPFSYWTRLLLCFSPLFLFEYSVVARNYGISILLIFVLSIYLSHKDKKPFKIGVLLFMLENTNVHSLVFAAGYSFILLADWRAGSQTARRANFARMIAIPGAFALLGLVACFLTVWPAKNDLAARFHEHRWIAQSVFSPLVSPGSYFEDILPSGFIAQYDIPYDGLAGTIILFALVFGLARYPAFLISGLIGIFGLALLFSLGYPGSARHEGLIIPYILSLYWVLIKRNSLNRNEIRRNISLSIAIPLVLATSIVLNFQFMLDQFSKPFSMSGHLGSLLNASPTLRQATVLSDLDYNVEALAYYSDNPTYLVREDRFGKTPIFTARAKLDIDLRELLRTARMLRDQTGKAVVMLVTAELDETGRETVTTTDYGWIFRYNDEQVREFREATSKVASLRGADRENYDVYVLE